MDIKKILTEAEQNHLVAFVENETQFNAAHKTFSALLREHEDKTVSVLLNPGTATNEDIGERFRACGEAVRLVETIFNSLLQYKISPPTTEVRVHPGR
jgi:hypothetical protein